MTIAAIMPCRGRAEQTVANVRRLLATAGDVEWRLICVCDGDREVYDALRTALPDMIVGGSQRQQGYWQCLRQGMQQSDDATHFVNLANDLLPGMHWLRRAADAYQATFGDGDGMIGFNDGIHEVGHSPHFLISRSLLDRFGGWPVWYQHNYGDTEMVVRATELGLYAKAPWAVLYHNHPYAAAGNHDAVYAEGEASGERDYALFQQRQRQGWPRVSP